MKELSKSCLIGRIWTPMDSLYFLRRTILLARLQGRDAVLENRIEAHQVLLNPLNYRWFLDLKLIELHRASEIRCHLWVRVLISSASIKTSPDGTTCVLFNPSKYLGHYVPWLHTSDDLVTTIL